MVDDNISGLNSLLTFYLSKKDNLAPLPKLLDGNEIMNILNIKPSKHLGEVVDALTEAQISGEVLTKDDAINFIKTL
jgi:tRNA nucleotidyltransferase/poly(A) polymerase